MALQTLQDIVFQNLRSNTQGRQVCLVDVAGDSVAVFPVDHRIEQIRRNSARKGFAAGVAAGAVVALLCVYLWSLFRQAPAPTPQAEAASQPAPAADPSGAGGDTGHGGGGDATRDAMAERIATLERRLADLESGAGGGRTNQRRPRQRRPRA